MSNFPHKMTFWRSTRSISQKPWATFRRSSGTENHIPFKSLAVALCCVISAGTEPPSVEVCCFSRPHSSSSFSARSAQNNSVPQRAAHPILRIAVLQGPQGVGHSTRRRNRVSTSGTMADGRPKTSSGTTVVASAFTASLS